VDAAVKLHDRYPSGPGLLGAERWDIIPGKKWAGGKNVQISIREAKDARVLAVEGDIDHASVGTLRQAFSGLLESTVGPIELDFSRVAYIDSAGICALYDFTSELDGRAPLKITRVSEQVGDILRISGLTLLEELHISPQQKGASRAPVETEAATKHQTGPRSIARSFPGRMDELVSVREFVEEIGAHGPLDEKQIFNLKLAVSEAAANAIEHGLADGDLEVRGTWHPDRLTVSVSHPGDFHHRTDDDPARFRRGMGLPLMLRLTDEVTIRSRVGRGTKVSLSLFFDDAA
jgi:anti-anti-sigma factor